MLSNIWAAVFVIILFGLIVWNMVKRDRSSRKRIGQEPVVKNFERLAPLYKVNFITNKLYDLEKLNLCPSDTKMKALRNRIRKLKEIKEKLVLQNYDEQCKCKEAMMWLRRSKKNRWSDPPSIIPACDPLSGRDLKLAIKLTKPPIDLSQNALKVAQKQSRSMGTETDKEERSSIPLVDKWMNKASIPLSHYLDRILVISIKTYKRAVKKKEIIKKARMIMAFLRGVIIVSTQVKGGTTTITIDFMMPLEGVKWKNGVPVAIPTGPQREIKGLRCTYCSVRYVPILPSI